jgi:hypothetical protein
MANVQQIKKSVELLFKEYLMGDLPPNESSSSTSSLSSNSQSDSSLDNNYNWLTGMTEDAYKLPAIVIICDSATCNPVSFNWDCNLMVEIQHHYADVTRAEHNAKVAEIRDKLIVATDDIIPILNTSTSLVDTLLYTPIGCSREVRDKKFVTTQTFSLKCNYNG